MLFAEMVGNAEFSLSDLDRLQQNFGLPVTAAMPRTLAQLQETIVSEETRAKRWDAAYGARLGGPEGYKVRHVWDPQSLSKEAKLFPSRKRSGVRSAPLHDEAASLDVP